METLRNLGEKINRICPPEVDCKLFYNEPMSKHSTLKVGGPADLWISPRLKKKSDIEIEKYTVLENFFARLKTLCEEMGVPFTVLGAGANIVVADAGIAGLVLDTAGLDAVFFTEGEDEEITAYLGAGLSVEKAVEKTVLQGLSGLDFLAGMPGTIGGAVWMNARCYGSAIADVLIETRYTDSQGNVFTLPLKDHHFDYKKSVFQSKPYIILGSRFSLTRGSVKDLQKRTEDLKEDREGKGHYRFPSAGSAFKNDRRIGKPSGKLIDELGLRGLSIGAAQIAPWHGNILINTGGASASDIKNLSERVQEEVFRKSGHRLECEILFIGRWA